MARDAQPRSRSGPGPIQSVQDKQAWTDRTGPIVHPQMNGNVEELNHKLIHRLQGMTVDDCDNWDSYLRRTLFAYSAPTNEHLRCSSFYLQYDVKPVLPSTATIVSEAPLTNVESHLERKPHVQDLWQYHTEAAEKYRQLKARLIDSRDDTAFERKPHYPRRLDYARCAQPTVEITPPNGTIPLSYSRHLTRTPTNWPLPTDISSRIS